MGTLEAFLVIMAVISGGLVVWSYTKSGKNGLTAFRGAYPKSSLEYIVQ